jgi:hypothetical protein
MLLALILGLAPCLQANAENEPRIATLYTPPWTFVPNTLIQSTQVNANFSSAAASINNIDNSNIPVTAAIDPVKLDHTKALGLFLMSNTATVALGVGTTGDTYPRIELFSDGSLQYGAGAGSVPDIGLFRINANTLGIRDAGNTAYRDLNARAGTFTSGVSGTTGTFTGSLSGSDLTLGTPLTVPNGGTGLATITSGRYMKGNGTGAVTLQAVPIPVADGGTGAITLTGYVKGNGAAAMTAQAVPIPVADGGTGAITLTGYVKGNGAAAMTAQAVPIPVADGGTGATSLTDHGAVVVSGAAQTTVAPGASGNVLKSNGTDWTSAAIPNTALQIGGDGSDGAITLNTTTNDARVFNATTLTTSGAITRTSTDTIYNATSTITVAASGTITGANLGTKGPGAGGTASAVGINGNGCVWAAAPAQTTWRQPFGEGSATGGVSAGGGGGAGAGLGFGFGGGNAGAGGGASSANGGRAGAEPNYLVRFGWPGGVAGTGAAATAGSAGDGGGSLRFYAQGAIDFSAASSLTVTGSAGSAGVTLAGGSGGGGGGSIWTFSATSINLGATKCTTDGGVGGAGAGANTDGGGGGGSGSVYQCSPSNSGSCTMNGGTGGAQGAGGTAGATGSSGTLVTVTGTPTYPTMAFVEDGRGFYMLGLPTKLARFFDRLESDQVCFTLDEQSVAFAAWYAKPGKFDDLRYCLNYTNDVDQAIACSVLDNEPIYHLEFGQDGKVVALPGLRFAAGNTGCNVEAMKVARTATKVSNVATGDLYLLPAA